MSMGQLRPSSRGFSCERSASASLQGLVGSRRVWARHLAPEGGLQGVWPHHALRLDVGQSGRERQGEDRTETLRAVVSPLRAHEVGSSDLPARLYQTATAPLKAPMIILVSKCPRCGSQHGRLRFELLANPGSASHFAMCPVLNQPIFSTLMERHEAESSGVQIVRPDDIDFG